MREQDLIIKLKNGDRQAFDVIYRMYACRLMTFCLSYVRITEDAEEIIQDIFISLWKNRQAIQNTHSLSPLLSASLRNNILYYFRRKLNSPIYEEFITHRDSIHPTEDGTDIEYREFRKMIIQEINELPRAQRDAIILSKLHGLSNREIAEKLDLSIQTIKNALSIGLKTLRKRLSDHPEIFPAATALVYSTCFQSIIQ